MAIILVASSGAAAQGGVGFVTYKVDAAGPSGQHSVIINETAGPSAKAGFTELVLQLIGGQQNLTYSRLVNASVEDFPYLSGVASQALDYANGTAYAVHLNVTATGTEGVTFQGSQYTLTVYSFVASVSYANRTLGADGTLATFPSSLLYSADVSAGNESAHAMILATDLQLARPSAQAPTAAVVGAGVGAGGVALAAALIVRRRERRTQTEGEKPLHWVD